ncbi:MAG: GMC oxidoreductase, partial [Cyanobacteria bacterium P01_F01_bin.86]
AIEGYYSGDDGELITLNFFSEIENSQFNQDKQIAKEEIARHLQLLNELGAQPHWLIKMIFRCLTKIPYETSQVDRYVETNSRRFLLSEQHLAGGCLFSKAIDPGLNDAQKAGIVYGSTNVHVADLSAMSLPRISPQMTAYLVGFYVADRLCCKGKSTEN